MRTNYLKKLISQQMNAEIFHLQKLSSGMFSHYFDERIECYRLHICLSGLILAAYLGNQQDYENSQPMT